MNGARVSNKQDTRQL